ncbi:MAG TPA: amino acid adenylation domain-containing protein, partial [Micromonosporaceae bacterium]|nr:amino acid adenylation domain-containing protein [Micromonosporaceae bacterium]
MTAQERDQLDEVLAFGRGGPLPDLGQPPVHDLVAGFARVIPGHTAVHSGERAIGYGALDEWAGRIAARLAAAGVGRGDRVGLLAEPSIAMVASALGILRSGAAYVPIDPAAPAARVADVLSDAQVVAAVVTGAGGARLAGFGLPLVWAEDSAGGSGRILPPVPITAEDAAYLIYTSGSTGEPKGVVVEHGQLAASTLARRIVYPGAPVFLLVSPLAFDSSVAGLWGTLTAGGRLVVATAEEVRDPERLVELIERHRVTQLLCVPSLYRVLLDAAERVGVQRLRSLDIVIVAGEPLPRQVVDRHFAVHPEPVCLVNEYGPTETTVWASYHRFDRPGPVSIGVPPPGARLYVLDENLRPVPPGVQGELFVGGAWVSRGYFGRPEATARVFLDDPFAGSAGARMYRTGDLVRWNPDGTLDFLGRRDHQVKIRGHRIELEAVEAALREVPGVRDAVVVADTARTRLTGFVLAEPGTDAAAARAALAERLPAPALPAIRILDGFPLTANGKVDRGALRAAAEQEPEPVTPEPVAETPDSTTARVAAAWADVLKLNDVPIDA